MRRALIPLAMLLFTSTARADDADRLKAAAEEFDQGRRAYLAKDWETAAGHFENAFRDAPRAETLRLAIKSRREAKQLARAATLAAVAKDQYASDAPTSQLAQQTLDEALPQLTELSITCSALCSVTADGRVASQADALKLRIYLEPGAHQLGFGFKTGSVDRKLDAKRGARESISVDAPPEPVAPPPPPPTKPDIVPPTPPEKPKPLSPVVFFVGAGLTVAAGAATIISGIDAKNNPGADEVRKQCAGKDESCPAYADGRSAQLRTNILIGATAGLGVLTGVVGIFFTDWGGGNARVGVGPGSVPLSGHF